MTSTTIDRPPPTAHVPSLAASIAHDRERVARAKQLQGEATARALPDDLFADDPVVQHLSQEHEAVDARVKRLARVNRADVQAAIKRIEQEIAQVQEQMRAAAVDDALAGDYEFLRSAALSRRVAALRHQLEGARLAFEVFAKPAPERNQFDDELRRAKEVLTVALLERKRAYVSEHPELLECDLDVVRQHKRQPPVSAPGPDARGTLAPAGAVDWERIERDYRAGAKSLREIAEGSGVSHVAISKHATKAGWIRGMSQETQAEADEAVNKPVDSNDSGVNSLSAASERDIDVAPAAIVAAEESRSTALLGEDAP